MKHKIPKTSIMGTQVEGAIERVLAERTTPSTQPNHSPTMRNQQIQNPEQHIFLPERTSPELLQHPDLLIAQELSYKGQDWQSCYDSVQQPQFMLPPWLFVEFINHLKTGNVLGGTQNQLPQQRIDQILDNILTVRTPYRAEWLNAQFEESNGLYINHLRFTPNPTQVREPLEDCLKEDKLPGINLDYWLQNATSQGIPPSNIQDGDLYFWKPRNNRVVRFNANSGRAYLSCDGNPASANAGLGVRVAQNF